MIFAMTKRGVQTQSVRITENREFFGDIGVIFRDCRRRAVLYPAELRMRYRGRQLAANIGACQPFWSGDALRQIRREANGSRHPGLACV